MRELGRKLLAVPLSKATCKGKKAIDLCNVTANGSHMLCVDAQYRAARLLFCYSCYENKSKMETGRVEILRPVKPVEKLVQFSFWKWLKLRDRNICLFSLFYYFVRLSYNRGSVKG